jgi:hypothetical protein
MNRPLFLLRRILGRFAVGLHELADPAIHVRFDASTLPLPEVIHETLAAIGVASGRRNGVSGKTHRTRTFGLPVRRSSPMQAGARVGDQRAGEKKDDCCCSSVDENRVHENSMTLSPSGDCARKNDERCSCSAYH